MNFFEANQEPQPFTKKNCAIEQLESLLETAIKEKDEVTKGRLFEEFFRNLVEREDEFRLIKLHARSDVGEMDYFYKATCKGHPLWDNYPYLFVECKNRKEVVSSKDMDHFVSMLGSKSVFTNCCGIYITTKSFSRQADASAKKGIEKGLVIFRINRSAMTGLIEKGLKLYLEEAFDELLSKI